MNWITSICLAAFLSVCESSAASLDFKGIPLGISIEKFKQLSHPDGLKNSRVECSDGESVAANELNITLLTPSERKTSLVKCVFFGSLTEDNFGDVVLPIGVGGGDYASWRYSFSFFPNRKTKVKELFEIVIPTNSNAFQDIRNALVDKFGSPNGKSRSKATNGLGAKIEQQTLTWTRKNQGLTLQSPWYKIDTLVVIYADEIIYSEFQKQLKRTKKNAM